MTLTLGIIFGVPILALAALTFWRRRNGISPLVEAQTDGDFTIMRHGYAGHTCCSGRTYKIPRDKDDYAKLFVPPVRDDR